MPNTIDLNYFLSSATKLGLDNVLGRMHEKIFSCPIMQTIIKRKALHNDHSGCRGWDSY